MKLFNLLKKFANNENGAMTVDWVVLTAAIVGLGIAVVSTVGGGIEGPGTAVAGGSETGHSLSLPASGR